MVKSEQKGVATPPSRQAAYLARNRQALLKAGQEVLAELGPNASIEYLAQHAQVSTTTIYKYFKNKDQLFAEALEQIWLEWVAWAYNGELQAQSLEAVIDVARRLFFVRKTHPFFAQILRHTLVDASFLIKAVIREPLGSMRKFAARSVEESADFEKRAMVFAYSLVGILTSLHVTEEINSEDAEDALGISLAIWDISAADAKKIMSRPLAVIN